MKRSDIVLAIEVLAIALGVFSLQASAPVQQPKAAEGKPAAPASTGKDAANGRVYSGLYSFLKEGEFLQLTVEDNGRVTGFISRFGDGASDKGAFLDQFFKKGDLDGNRLSFTTEIVHGVSFEFKGTVERGEGKNPGDEAYFVLKGTLTENANDVNKKTTSHSREVAFKIFPQDASPVPATRN